MTEVYPITGHTRQSHINPAMQVIKSMQTNRPVNMCTRNLKIKARLAQRNKLVIAITQ